MINIEKSIYKRINNITNNASKFYSYDLYTNNYNNNNNNEKTNEIFMNILSCWIFMSKSEQKTYNYYNLRYLLFFLYIPMREDSHMHIGMVY